jgi:hypothetical protein
MQNGYLQELTSREFAAADGTFRIRGQRGEVQVSAHAPGWTLAEAVKANVGPDGAEVELKLIRAAQVGGLVTDLEGNPLSGLTVWIGRQQVEIHGLGDVPELEFRLRGALRGEHEFRTGNTEGPIVSVKTGSDGRYAAESVKPGQTRITVWFIGEGQSSDVELVPGSNFQDFRLDAACRVRVTAIDEKGVATPPGSVWFEGSSGEGIQAHKVSATDFVYEFAGLPEGELRVCARPPGFAPARKLVNLQRGLNNVELRLEAPAVLRGRVTPGSGRLPGAAHVVLSPDLGDRRDNPYANAVYVQLGEDGTYRSEGLAPGRYMVRVQLSHGDVIHQTDARLTSGEQTLDLVVQPACSLRVTVRRESGLSMDTPVHVGVSHIRGGVSRGNGAVGTDFCEFDFLPLGEYRVTAWASGAMQAEANVTLQLGGNSVTITIGAPNCVRVTSITGNSQAEALGLQRGDLITEYNGQVVAGMEVLRAAVKRTTESDNVSMIVVRGGATLVHSLKGGLIGITGEDHRR